MGGWVGGWVGGRVAGSSGSRCREERGGWLALGRGDPGFWVWAGSWRPSAPGTWGRSPAPGGRRPRERPPSRALGWRAARRGSSPSRAPPTQPRCPWGVAPASEPRRSVSLRAHPAAARRGSTCEAKAQLGPLARSLGLSTATGAALAASVHAGSLGTPSAPPSPRLLTARPPSFPTW